MFVRWGKPNNHLLSSHDGKTQTILRPGWNEIDSAVWKENENDPEIKEFIRLEQLEVSEIKIMHGKKVVTDLGKSDAEVHLAEIKDEKQCLSIIKDTYNMALLTRWNDEETRHPVKRALAKQIKRVENPNEDQESDKNDQKG